MLDYKVLSPKNNRFVPLLLLKYKWYQESDIFISKFPSQILHYLCIILTAFKLMNTPLTQTCLQKSCFTLSGKNRSFRWTKNIAWIMRFSSSDTSQPEGKISVNNVVLVSVLSKDVEMAEIPQIHTHQWHVLLRANKSTP